MRSEKIFYCDVHKIYMAAVAWAPGTRCRHADHPRMTVQLHDIISDTMVKTERAAYCNSHANGAVIAAQACLSLVPTSTTSQWSSPNSRAVSAWSVSKSWRAVSSLPDSAVQPATAYLV